jgi:hypothetical protein
VTSSYGGGQNGRFIRGPNIWATAFAALVPLGLLFAMYRAFSHRGSVIETGLLAVWVGLGVVWWISLHRVPRFGLPLLALACVLSAPPVLLLQRYASRGVAILLLGCVVITCGISGFVALREFGGRIKNHRWSRDRVYGYPKLVDELPAGTTLINNTGIRDANYTLAGSKQANRVIADFEVPSVITPEFLAARHVDFVVEATEVDGEKAPLRPAGQFSPGNREVLSAIAGGRRWTFCPVAASASKP